MSPGRALTAEIIAVLSERMIQELRRAMDYRRIRPRIRLTDEELQMLPCRAALRFRDRRYQRGTVRVPRDRRDDIVLATYLASRADCLLTGDADLLALRPPHAILTAREFYDQHLR